MLTFPPTISALRRLISLLFSFWPVQGFFFFLLTCACAKTTHTHTLHTLPSFDLRWEKTHTYAHFIPSETLELSNKLQELDRDLNCAAQWLCSSKGILETGNERRRIAGGREEEKKNLCNKARVTWQGIRAKVTAHAIHPGLLLVIRALHQAAENSVCALDRFVCFL